MFVMGKYKYLEIYRKSFFKREKNLRIFGALMLLFATSITSLVSISRPVYAATRTWDGGCGGDTSWSCDANWSSDTEPASGDTVVFDNTSDNNSTVDATFGGTIAVVTISSGYDGTITLARSLIVSGAFSQASGSFTAADQTLDMNSTFTLSAGNFTASSGSTTLAGAMTISGSPTFTANGGTWTFDGTGTATLSCGNVTFSSVAFTHTSNAKTVSSDCSLPLGASPSPTGPITLAGTLSGSGTLTMGTGFIVSGAGVLSGFSTFDVNSTFTMNASSSFTAPTSMSVSSTFTINSTATFNANGGTLTFDGTGTATLSCGSATFSSVAFTHTSNAKTVSSDCSLPLGASPSPTGPITLAGTLSGSGTLTMGTGFIVSGAGVLSGFSTFDVNSTFTMNASSSFTAPTSMSVSSTFTINSTATFNANGGTLTFDGTTTATVSCGNATFNLVVLSHTTNIKTISSDCSLPLGSNPSIAGPVTLNGTFTGSGTLAISAAFIYGTTGSIASFTGFTNSSTTTVNGTWDAGDLTTFDINQVFTLASTGNLTAPAGDANFAQAVTLNAGSTFDANGGTVVIDGTSSVTITCNSATFNLVEFAHTGGTKTAASSCSLPLGSNPTVGSGTSADLTVAGTLSGTGTITVASVGAGNTLTLGSAAAFSGFSGLQTGDLTVNGATIDFSSYSTFTVSDAYGQGSGGTITMPSGTDIAGALTITAAAGSTLNAPSGTMHVGSTFTIGDGNTFNHSGGTVDFDGVSGTLSCDNHTFNLMTFNHAGGTKTISSDCVIPLGADPTLGIDGSLTVSGTLSGSGTLTASKALTLNSGSVLSGFSALETTTTLAISGATTDLGAYTSVDVNGNFSTSSGGVFTAPSSTMTVGGDFTINSGTTFNDNGGTLTFDASTASLSCNSNSFNLVTFAHTTGTKTVNDGCSLPLGSNPTTGTTTSAAISLSGILSGSDTITFSGTITVNSTGSLSGFSGLVANNNVAINGATLSLGSYSTVDLNSSFTLSSGGVFTAPSSTMTVADEFTLNSGTTFNANSGTITFDANSDSTLACNSTTFNLVTFAHTGGTKIVGSDCSLPLGTDPDAGAGGSITQNGTLSGSGTLTTTGTLLLNSGSAISGFDGLNTDNLTVNTETYNFGSYNTLDVDGDFTVESNGTVTATSANMTVGGDFTVESGSTFNHNNGTVILDGSDQTIVGTTFNNLNKTVASAATLTMPASSTETILGILTLKGGSASALLTLVSSSPSTSWIVDVQGTSNVEYVAVSDSQNLGSIIDACSSIDNGNNSGWTFTSVCDTGEEEGGEEDGGSDDNSSSDSSDEEEDSIVVYDSGEAEDKNGSSKDETTDDEAEDVTDSEESGIVDYVKNNPSSKWLVILAIPGSLLLLWWLIFALRRRKDDEDGQNNSPTTIYPSS